MIVESGVKRAKLKEFQMLKVVGVVQKQINSMDHDIPGLMREIEEQVKGTKAEPFLNKVKDYF